MTCQPCNRAAEGARRIPGIGINELGGMCDEAEPWEVSVDEEMATDFAALGAEHLLALGSSWQGHGQLPGGRTVPGPEQCRSEWTWACAHQICSVVC